MSETLGRGIAWLTLVMALVTFSIVVLRYLFDQGTILLQESVLYMHGFAFMLAIPYALKDQAHVRVDIIYAKLDKKRQALIDVIGHVVFLLPTCAFIFMTSWPYVAASWRVMEKSSEVGGIPAVFVLKTLIPVMAVLLAVQGCIEIARLSQRLRG